MIEFAILFGLGFLTAALAGLLLAPVVLKRVVWFTENRLRATTPLSPQEVRAQKDMVRALYAAENAKVGQDLVKEREKGLALQLRHETAVKDTARLQSENSELQMQINDMNVEAADLRSRLRRDDSYVEHLKGKLNESQETIGARSRDIETLQKRINKLVSDADNLKIDMATYDTQAESMQSRIASLRDERDSLRHDLKLMTQRAKEAENRLSHEEHKALRFEERLIREQTLSADRETMLERRTQDNARLKEKLKKANAETREIGRSLRQGSSARLASASKQPPLAKGMLPAATVQDTHRDAPALVSAPDGEFHPEDISELADEVRNQNTALAERLLRARTPAHDAALREEISSVAAQRVVLTAMTEGAASPIPALLAGADSPGVAGRTSLAERIGKTMASETAS